MLRLDLKKILLKLSVGAVFLLGGFLIFTGLCYASASDNVHGWAWSDNIGWISFNCTEGGPSQSNICGTSTYGVTISTSTHVFSGNAWSDNIGWISFDVTAGECPDHANCTPTINPANGQVSGWAKAVNLIGDDYGWIKLRDTLYGLSVDLNTGRFSDYAWGGGTTTSTAVIGWISSSGTGYYIWTNPLVFNNSPYVENTNITGPNNNDLCNNTANYFLNWTFRDIDIGAYENTYELRLTNTGTGSSGTSSPGPYLPNQFEDGDDQSQGVLIGTSESLSLTPLRVRYGQTYSWEVRVQDNDGLWSSWTSGPGFTVPINYPECGFTMSPTKPKIGDEINFQDTSTSDPGSYSVESYFWDFGDSTAASTQNATHTYSEVSPRTVTHTIHFDSGTKSCSTSTTFNVRPGQPEYIEVIPR
ncbi:MAG: PKD domain-containing protein [Candidatus Paceibacterota bacterium]|jgi:PKD repeat protein